MGLSNDHNHRSHSSQSFFPIHLRFYFVVAKQGMIALVIVGLLLFLLTWLLFWPWVVEVDTTCNTYQCYQKGTVRFWLTTDFQPHLRIFGITVPLKPSKEAHPKKAKVITEKRKRPFRVQYLLDLVKGILHSIKVNWFYLDVDTDDVVLNAQLVPVFYWLSNGPVHLATNFEGRVYSRIRAELKLYRMGWAFLLFFTKNKTYGNEF